MSRRLTASIAWRYLWSKKSHSAVSAIATVSIIGVAVATAAIVCVLSVFNGFREVIGERLDTLQPEIIVEPASGKVFEESDALLDKVRQTEEVATATLTLTDNALAICDNREMPVTLKGVEPSDYAKVSAIRSILKEGSEYFPSAAADYTKPADALIAIGTALQLKAYGVDIPMLIFSPRREGRINTANPLASFTTDSIMVTGVFQARQSQYDENFIIVPIDVARDLFQYYEGEASAIEIALRPGSDPQSAAQTLRNTLGDSVVVKDRLQQQEMNFRMVAIEKWVTFLILVFILIIASFNLVSTLSMLILEKQNSLTTLHSLGLTKRAVGNVFWWESLFVALLGGTCGIILGVTLCLIQQYTGIIKLNGDPSEMVISSYPVVLLWSDLIVAAVPVIVIGVLTGLVSSAFARSRIGKK